MEFSDVSCVYMSRGPGEDLIQKPCTFDFITLLLQTSPEIHSVQTSLPAGWEGGKMYSSKEIGIDHI